MKNPLIAQVIPHPVYRDCSFVVTERGSANFFGPDHDREARAFANFVATGVAEETQLERLAKQHTALQGEFEIYHRTCEITLTRAAALEETYRQAFEQALGALRAGDPSQVETFLEGELARMEDNRKKLDS